MVTSVSIPEAAKFLGVTEKTIRNYIKRGFLKPIKWNGTWRIEKRELREIYEKKNGKFDFQTASQGEFPFDLTKEEFVAQMISLGKLEMYEGQVEEQKQAIDKLNSRILQLEASSASGWTEARAAQQNQEKMSEELRGMRKSYMEQQEAVAWLRREKDELSGQLEKEIKTNLILRKKIENLEDQLHMRAIMG